jgi:hypothetical protein
MLSRQQRLRKVPERSILCDIRHRLSIDDQRGSWFSAPSDFNCVAH